MDSEQPSTSGSCACRLEHVDVSTEYESSFKMKLTSLLFSNLVSSLMKRDNNKICRHYIYYYNDGKRLIKSLSGFEYVFQTKTVHESNKIMRVYFHDDNEMYFFPVVRTKACEIMTSVPNSQASVVKIITRYIVAIVTNTSTNRQFNNVRIALEEHVTKIGSDLMLSCEIEYSEETYRVYSKTIEIEDIFFKIILNNLQQFEVNFNNTNFLSLDHITSDVDIDLFNAPSKKFHHLFNLNLSTNVTLFKKWDGLKGRLVCNNNGIIYYDDLKKMYFSDNINCNIYHKLSLLKNVVLQCEILLKDTYRENGDTRSDGMKHRRRQNQYNTLILTDVLGVFVPFYQGSSNKFFACEPLDAMKILEHISQFIDGELLVFPEVLFHVDTQKRITSGNCINIQNNKNVDGLIILFGNRLYKFKPPTFDMRFTKNHFYLENSKQIFNIHDPKEILTDGIYEFCWTSENEYEKIRKRYDRNCSSTMTEFLNSKREAEFIFKIAKLNL